jgi:hypothetical protein
MDGLEKTEGCIDELSSELEGSGLEVVSGSTVETQLVLSL